MKKKFNIKGMHCNSCATLIENELKDKVKSIKVSYSDEKAEIDFNENKISEREIRETIKKLGYELKEREEEKENPKKSKNKTGWVFVGISIALLLFIIYYFFIRNLDLSSIRVPEIGEKTGLILLFAAGILTGFHCISMCGAFVVSYTTKNAMNGHKSFKQHLVYGGSKVLSYTIIGGIFGLIGGLIAFSTKLRGFVAIFAGAFMIVYAFSMFGIKFFKKFQINPKFLTRLAARTSSKAKGPYKGPFITGLLNGLFIACGPLQAMYMYAAGTGSLLNGAMSLAAFGLGTLPIMLGFGSLATVISHKTTAKILKISAIIVLILGLIMLNRGLSLTGSSFNFDSIKNQIIGGAEASSSVVQNGVQEINMDVDGSGYSPRSFAIKQGVPVKWNVNVKQLTGCNSELVMSDYGIDIRLKQGINTVNFTPNKVGTIQFSCGMGMLRGSFIVTETGTATQQQLAAATPKTGGSSCSMGAGGGGCGCGG
ncbi:MAG: sulfite exporter TauE/SafE family protein [Nanoarchaeota archaeon]|nr:sulfite exporter TauE/SafE family protein [Nanoarchaeota archaeon]